MKETFLFVIICILGISLKPRALILYIPYGKTKPNPDSTREEAYEDYIVNDYLYSWPDTAAMLAEALHAYAKKQHYPKASATGYKLQGMANYVLGNYPHRLWNTSKSLWRFRKNPGIKRHRKKFEQYRTHLHELGN
ncbi:MAG: hypothetical protein R3C61_17440 [Bacteroidia bacterium]